MVAVCALGCGAAGGMSADQAEDYAGRTVQHTRRRLGLAAQRGAILAA